MSPYDTSPVPIIERGEGCYIWDTNGKKYLDALSGLFVVQVGHGREELAAGGRRAGPQAGLLPDLVVRASRPRSSWPTGSPPRHRAI